MSLMAKLIMESNQTSQSKQESRVEQQLVLSKLKSMNEHLQSLLQKRIRIDLEIKSLKKRISKTKSNAETKVKATLALENLQLTGITQNQLEELQRNIGPEDFDLLVKLDEQVEVSSELLERLEEIPLFE